MRQPHEVTPPVSAFAHSLLPAALAQVRRDAVAGRFAAWGASTLIDEFTGVPTIGRELFDALQEAAGLAAEFPVGNAGLLHVYGYWFSEVSTPFGLKRDRWEQGELSAALGLPREAFLLGSAPERTLLERVTAVALPLLRGLDEDAAALAEDADVRVADAIVGARLSRVVCHRAPGAVQFALVYGVTPDGESSPEELRLVTVFPVGGGAASDEAVAAILAEFTAAPRLRWNAVEQT